MTGPSSSRLEVSLRVTLSGDGRPGPIEERLGRRLIRLVDPESEEGLALLRSGRVNLVGPGGEKFGCMHPTEACRRLRERLEKRLADPDAAEERDALRDGLNRLEAWSERIGRC
jgi:hypothetical protein